MVIYVKKRKEKEIGQNHQTVQLVQYNDWSSETIWLGCEEKAEI